MKFIISLIPRTSEVDTKVKTASNSDNIKNILNHEIITYKPHPVITRLKESLSINNNKINSEPGTKIGKTPNKNTENIVENTNKNCTNENESSTVFLNIVDKLEYYYEEKMKIEVEKLKVHFEKEMLQICQQQQQQHLPVQKCCCSCKDEKSGPQMQMVVTSLNQVNVSLQKRNEELTNQLLTVLLHVKNERLQNDEQEKVNPPRVQTARKQIEKKKSLMCSVM